MARKTRRFTLVKVLKMIDIIVDLAVIVALAAIPATLSSQ